MVIDLELQHILGWYLSPIYIIKLLVAFAYAIKVFGHFFYL